VSRPPRRPADEWLWEIFVDSNGGHCIYPGCTETKVERAHIKPVRLGGDGSLENLEPLCGRHNKAESRKNRIEDWRDPAWRERFFILLSRRLQPDMDAITQFLLSGQPLPEIGGSGSPLEVKQCAALSRWYGHQDPAPSSTSPSTYLGTHEATELVHRIIIASRALDVPPPYPLTHKNAPRMDQLLELAKTNPTDIFKGAVREFFREASWVPANYPHSPVERDAWAPICEQFYVFKDRHLKSEQRRLEQAEEKRKREEHERLNSIRSVKDVPDDWEGLTDDDRTHKVHIEQAQDGNYAPDDLEKSLELKRRYDADRRRKFDAEKDELKREIWGLRDIRSCTDEEILKRYERLQGDFWRAQGHYALEECRKKFNWLKTDVHLHLAAPVEEEETQIECLEIDEVEQNAVLQLFKLAAEQAGLDISAFEEHLQGVVLDDGLSWNFGWRFLHDLEPSFAPEPLPDVLIQLRNPLFERDASPAKPAAPPWDPSHLPGI